MSTGRDSSQRGQGWFLRFLGYFSVLRPSFVFGLIIFYLPLTALELVPGSSMLGNLFVEYRFSYGFWFGLALFGAVWAVMITAGLTLDIERDRTDSWVYDPGRKRRRVTIPLLTASPFLWFSLLGAPGVLMVLWKAENALSAGCGMLLGGFLAYFLMDLTIYLGRCNDSGFHLFPWPPFFGLPPVRALGTLHRIAARILSWIAKVVFRLPDNIFNNPPQDTILKDDHLFAGLSLIEVSSAYLAVYWLLKPGSWTQLFQINSVPPAAFIYALLLPLIWLISAFWVHLKRYRIMLLGGILIGVTPYGIGGTRYVEETIGGSAHTYDVLTIARPEPLPAEEVLQPLQNLKYEDGKKPNLIIVAASGGGILAAGWTTKVLTELHKEYRHFPEELRLVSAVSGGSVGTVHYVSAFSEDRGGVGLSEEELQRIVKDAMKSSLSITSYGFAFPDFRRALFPLWTDETFDRARLGVYQIGEDHARSWMVADTCLEKSRWLRIASHVLQRHTGFSITRV